MNFVLTYFIIISTISFILMYIDKKKAINGEFRISESTFMRLSILGGAIGVYLGMYTFRHKTKHAKFTIGVPICLLLNLILYYIILNFII